MLRKIAKSGGREAVKHRASLNERRIATREEERRPQETLEHPLSQRRHDAASFGFEPIAKRGPSEGRITGVGYNDGEKTDPHNCRVAA